MQSRFIGLRLGSSLVCVCAMVFSMETASADLDVIVPAYFYPVNNSPWDDLNDAASQVDITAILNPGSGPGAGQDSNYVSVVNALRSAGGRVIGYVHTSYGARDLNTVLGEIDDYNSWYNIDGIFIDEMANTGPAEKLDYYRDIYNHVKSINADWKVVGNPGTDTLEQYLTWPTADQFVIFENFGSAYAGDSTASWVFDYQRTHFAHLIHSEPSSATMLNDLNLAVARNAGSIYITNDVLGNPWDQLPTYWQAEVDAIEQINNALLEGDFNENGTVDNTDLDLWNGGYGITDNATKYEGDSDEDGDVDGQDFLQWQIQSGLTTMPVTFGAIGNPALSVPEPSSAGLLAIAYLVGNIVLRLRHTTHPAPDNWILTFYVRFVEKDTSQ